MSSRPVSNRPNYQRPTREQKQIPSEEGGRQWSHVLRSYLNKIMVAIVKSFLEIIVEIIKSLPKIVRSALINPVKTIQVLLLLFLIFILRQIINWSHSIFRPIHALRDIVTDIGHGLAHGVSAVGHGLGGGARALGHGAGDVGHGLVHGVASIVHGLGGGIFQGLAP